jgi:hypothetical protein
MTAVVDKWRMRGPFGDVEVEMNPSPTPDAAEREGSARELGRLVRDFIHRAPEARQVLLDVYARLQGLRRATLREEAYDLDSGSTRAAAIGAELMHAALTGNLVLRRRESRSVVVPIEGGDDGPVLGPQAEPTGWIAIELVDDQGKPVPNVAYVIKCDDGRVRTGTTNGEGKAREEGLHDGNCKVSFPDLHGPDWKAA